MRILIFVLFAFPLFAQSDSAVAQAVLAANRQVTAAAEARDLEGLFGFMVETAKGSIVQNGVLSLTPQDAKARVAPGFRAPVKVTYRWKQHHVTVLSSEAALLVSEGETIITAPNADPVSVPFVQSAVWVRRDGAWKILHAHQSSPRL
jgi:ketosteroid isomerase-like protein